MEIKKNKTIIHLLLSSYTIGFVLGGLAFFISEINKDFLFSFSIESIFCFIILLPIIYWVYRYSGMVFNDQKLIIRLLYILLCIIGFGLGVIFFELSLK